MSIKPKRKWSAEFVREAIYAKYGDQITVPDDFKIKGSEHPIQVICKHHGLFTTTPYRITLDKTIYGCGQCAPNAPKGWDNIKTNLIHKHGNLYDYSLNEGTYKRGKALKIICKEHGVFLQTYNEHSKGSGCHKCYLQQKTLTVNKFLLAAITKHGDTYDYDYVFEDFRNGRSSIRIICKKHGVFKQRANDHKNGVNCPACKVPSKGESCLRQYLVSKGVVFEPQKTFVDCFVKYKLRYDFYLPHFNLLIEFDGVQHHKPTFYTGDEGFDSLLARDAYKSEYAATKGISLIRLTSIQQIYTDLEKLLFPSNQ